MCTNTKIIYNKYIRKHLRVGCGKCEACLQQKADARANRIRYNLKPGEICLMVTLTYKNDYIPYIDLRGLQLGININVPVFRSSDCFSARVSGDYVFKDKSTGKVEHLFDIPVFNYNPNDLKTGLLRNLNGMPHYMVGVCYYKDAQDFMKRLRINLQRKYHYYEKFTYYCCSEYGGSSHRPHFHMLFFIKPEYEATFRRCIVESWKYADKYRTLRGIEIARDCASYVSSYVNSNSSLCEGFSKGCVMQKHSYSKHFGMGFYSFSLNEILSKKQRGDMSFCRQPSAYRLSEPFAFPIPKYVINRYFPKFKGYSRFSDDTLFRLISGFVNFATIAFTSIENYEKEIFKFPPPVFDIQNSRFVPTFNDDSRIIRSIVVSLSNSFKRYHFLTGRSLFDYARDFIDVWKCHMFTCERLLHQQVTCPVEYTRFYDEFHFKDESLLFDTLMEFDCSVPICLDPNLYPYRVEHTFRLSEKYRKYTKQRKVTNYIMSNFLNFNV